MSLNKKVIYFIFCCIVNANLYAQIPNSNLKLWLRADTNVIDSSNIINSWIDNSVNSYSAIQSNVNYRPSLEFDNDIQSNTIKFDGINDILFTNFGTRTPQPNTYFVVWKSTSTTSKQFCFSSDPQKNNFFLNVGNALLGGGTGSFFGSQITPFSYIISTCEINGASSKLYKNGLLRGTSFIGNDSLDIVLEIGGSVRVANLTPNDPGRLNGNIAEFIMYDTILSSTERTQVENYLANKYIQKTTLGSNIDTCAEAIKIGFKNNPQYEKITWSTGDVNVDSINISQNGTYWVSIESFGLTFSDTINVSGLVPKPQISISSNQVICYGDSIEINYLPLPSHNVVWLNGQTSNTIIIKDSSQFVQLTHSDTNNCSASSEIYFIEVDSFSLNSTLGPDRVFCLGSELKFTSQQKNNKPYQFTYWSTGDSSNFISLNTSSDTIISVFVEDFYGCVFEDTILAQVNNIIAPTVNFISDTVCYGNASTLVSISAANGADAINNYTWSFPNNSTSSGTITTYSHFEESDYNVTLAVTTDSSCENSITLPVKLLKLPNPNFNTAIVCAENPISFTTSSSVDLPDSLVTYQWFINDTFVSNSINGQITFQSNGQSALKLITITKFGCSDSISKQIEVFPELNADFSFQNNCVGDSVAFFDETESFSVVDWSWNFGSSNSSSMENPKIVFNTIGSKQVSLNIENAIGCKSSINKDVLITSQPIASFNYDKACENEKSLFYDNSIVLNDSIINYNWQIDTLAYNGDSIEHFFPELSIYVSSLNIETANGCKDDTTVFITVNENPIPGFEFSPDYGTAPLEVTFNNLTPGTNTYNWDFGDGIGTAGDENPTYTYTENGIYNISLTAINTENCDADIQKEIAVIPSDLDIELSKLEFDIQENTNGTFSIKPKLQIKNVGTRLITNADFVLSLNQNNKIAQQWEQNLNVGGTLNYIFDAYYLVSDIENSKYVCVEAINVNDNTEINLNNNKTCQLLDGIVQFSSPYPNPAEEKVQLDIITKDKTTCSLQVFSVNGKTMTEKQQIQLKNGYNNIVINTKNYLSGKYVIMMEYLDEKYSKSFVIK